MKPIYTTLLAATIAMASAQASATEWNNPDAPPCLTVDEATCREINAHADMRIQELFASCAFIAGRTKDIDITRHCFNLAVETVFFEADEMRMRENDQ